MPTDNRTTMNDKQQQQGKKATIPPAVLTFNPYAKKQPTEQPPAQGSRNGGSSNTGGANNNDSNNSQPNNQNKVAAAGSGTRTVIGGYGSANPYLNKKRFREDDIAQDIKFNLERTTRSVDHGSSIVYDILDGSNANRRTSFSQAFEAVEDTNYYKEQIVIDNDSGPVSSEEQTLRTKQREFDKPTTVVTEDTILAEAINPHTSDGNRTSNAFRTDRDHHVLFQQPHVLYVSTKQKGNGILQYVRNVPITYQTMEPDYIMSTTRCALFLSIKYHNLFPQYIHKRIAGLKTDFELRLLLVLVDVEDNAAVLLQLNKVAVTHNLTLVLAWSEEEAARYLETYKVMDGKDAKSIQKKEQLYFGDQVADFLTTKKTGVNKTDSALLLQQFDTIRNIATASIDEIILVHGMGEIKVRKLYEAFHRPFSKKLSKQRRKQQQKMLLEQKEKEMNGQEKNINNEPILLENENIVVEQEKESNPKEKLVVEQGECNQGGDADNNEKKNDD